MVAPKFSLSMELRRLAGLFKDRPVCLSEVVHVLQGRSYDLLLIILTLPFMTPVPLPGFSTPIGILITLAGFRLALGQKPWWPPRLLGKQLPARFFQKLLIAASKVVSMAEYLLKPRLHIFHNAVVFQRVSGAFVAFSGLFLLLPLPVPFSNFFPAFTVLLFAAGALARDGLFFLAGLTMFLVTTAFFALLSFGGVQAIKHLFGLS